MKSRIEKLLSIGACVPFQTTWDVLGRYDHVINFCFQDRVIALCTQDICRAPNRIVVAADSLEGVGQISVAQDIITIEDQVFLFSENLVYRTPALMVSCTENLLKASIQELKREFIKKAPEKCVAILSRYYPGVCGGFDLELGKSYARGEELFLSGRYSEAVECYRGKGFGLTPGGDDFLNGMLIGLGWLNKPPKKTLSEIVESIMVQSRGNNALVNSTMWMSCHLQLDEDWAGLLGSLASGSGAYSGWLERILAHGSTSGADELSGFFLAAELYYRQAKG